MRGVKKTIVAVTMSLSLSVAGMMPLSVAASTIEERPSGSAMFADALMRPVMVVGVALGLGTFVISLPLSLAGGNAEEAAQKLVVNPAKATFMRCLGCTKKHQPGETYY